MSTLHRGGRGGLEGNKQTINVESRLRARRIRKVDTIEIPSRTHLSQYDGNSPTEAKLQIIDGH